MKIMDERSKKAMYTVLLSFFGIGVIIYLAMIIFLNKELGVWASFYTPVDIREASVNEFDDIKAVDTTLNMAFGVFDAEATKTRSRTQHGKATYTQYYHAVAVNNGGETYYFAVEVSDKKSRDYYLLRSATSKFLDGENIDLKKYEKPIEASVRRMDDYSYKKLKNWIWEKGAITDRDELDTHVFPYVMQEVDFEVNRMFAYFELISCGIGIIILMVGLIYGYKRFWKKQRK